MNESYRPCKIETENMTAEINKMLDAAIYFEVPKDVYYPAKDLPPYDPTDDSNYLDPNVAEIVASAMQKLGGPIYNINVRLIRQPYHIYGVWVISMFTGYGINPERQIPVYINPYCEWRIQAASKEEAEEIACGALLKWFYNRYPWSRASIKKVARGLNELTESQNNP